MQHDYVLYYNKHTNLSCDDILDLFDELAHEQAAKLTKHSEIWMQYAPRDGVDGFARAEIIRVVSTKKSTRVLYSCKRCYVFEKGETIVSGEGSSVLFIVQNQQRLEELVGEEPKYQFIGA